MDLNEMVDAYIMLRDKKARIEADCKAKLVPVEEMMETFENQILTKFNELGVTSAKTEAGTAYIVERSSTSVADRDAFLAFVKAQEAWDMLENRVKKEAVLQYKEAHGDLPPGVNFSSVRKVNVRR